MLQVLLTVKDKLLTHFEQAITGCDHVIHYQKVCIVEKIKLTILWTMYVLMYYCTKELVIDKQEPKTILVAFVCLNGQWVLWQTGWLTVKGWQRKFKDLNNCFTLYLAKIEFAISSSIIYIIFINCIQKNFCEKLHVTFPLMDIFPSYYVS